MRKRNWHEYNKKLVQRGSLTFLIQRLPLKAEAEKKSASPKEPKYF
jgi:hypothetical protein